MSVELLREDARALLEKKRRLHLICRMAGNAAGFTASDVADRPRTSEEIAVAAVDIALSIIEEAAKQLGLPADHPTEMP